LLYRHDKMPMIQPTILPINEYSAMDLDMPVGFHVVR
jgi:hypothetical protein